MAPVPRNPLARAVVGDRRAHPAVPVRHAVAGGPAPVRGTGTGTAVGGGLPDQGDRQPSRAGVAAGSVLVCARDDSLARRMRGYAPGPGAVRAATSGDDALARLAERPADVVVADTAAVRPRFTWFIRGALGHSPRATVLLVNADRPWMAVAALAAGARGVLCAGTDDELVAALARGLLTARTGARPALSDRELQVLRGMSEGCTNAQIARELYITEDTVKTHARRLYTKLGVRDRAHAVATALRAGLTL